MTPCLNLIFPHSFDPFIAVFYHIYLINTSLSNFNPLLHVFRFKYNLSSPDLSFHIFQSHSKDVMF